jgi:hypothetical protein
VSNLLPWHPRRLNDEILSSWMLRIAAGNNVSVRAFAHGLETTIRFGRWMHGAQSPLINSIAAAIGVEEETVNSVPSF